MIVKCETCGAVGDTEKDRNFCEKYKHGLYDHVPCVDAEVSNERWVQTAGRAEPVEE